MHDIEDPRKSDPLTEPNIATENDKIAARFWSAVAILGVGLFVTGLVILGHQCLLWLRDGYWTGREFQEALTVTGLGDLSTEWQGVNKIIQWIMECPLSGGLIWSGAVTAYFSGWRAEVAKDRGKKLNP